jgi:hypothetical protein
MVQRAKEGDSRLQVLDHLATNLRLTPVELLETDASTFLPSHFALKMTRLERFHYQVSFQLLHELAPTKTMSKMFVMRCTLSKPPVYLKTFQAVGPTTRHAKFQAAKQALQTLKKLQPGFQYAVGDVPSNWHDWTFQNLDQQVSPAEVLQLLTTKVRRLTLMK